MWVNCDALLDEKVGLPVDFTVRITTVYIAEGKDALVVSGVMS